MNEDDVINLKRDIKLNNIITVIIMERIPTLIYGRDRNMFIGGNYKLLLTGYVHDSSYIYIMMSWITILHLFQR